jgi:four helix bundle protein
MKRKHRDLQVWQAAMNLVSAVYELTSGFPSEERFGLTAQMRRAAVSIPSNIAEGAVRSGTRELLNFLAIAAASASELDTQLEIARRLGYVTAEGGVAEQLDHLGEQLIRFVRSFCVA